MLKLFQDAVLLQLHSEFAAQYSDYDSITASEGITGVFATKHTLVGHRNEILKRTIVFEEIVKIVLILLTGINFREQRFHITARTFRDTLKDDGIDRIFLGLFHRIVDRTDAVRYIMLNFNNIAPEGSTQLSLFVDEESIAEERSRQEAILDIKRKFGKNALLKGIDLMPQATQRDRNRQIGGHKSGE